MRVYLDTCVYVDLFVFYDPKLSSSKEKANLAKLFEALQLMKEQGDFITILSNVNLPVGLLSFGWGIDIISTPDDMYTGIRGGTPQGNIPGGLIDPETFNKLDWEDLIDHIKTYGTLPGNYRNVELPDVKNLNRIEWAKQRRRFFLVFSGRLCTSLHSRFLLSLQYLG